MDEAANNEDQQPQENAEPAAAAPEAPAAEAAPESGESAPLDNEIEGILDIPLRINVELGRCKILVNDLIKLHQGSVIELSKNAGEPLDVLVNDKVVAKGEVIVVNEKFGIRLTDIVNHTERIRQLGKA